MGHCYAHFSSYLPSRGGMLQVVYSCPILAVVSFSTIHKNPHLDPRSRRFLMGCCCCKSSFLSTKLLEILYAITLFANVPNGSVDACPSSAVPTTVCPLGSIRSS